MELNEQQKEEVVIKLGVLCHLLQSASQVMQDITKICQASQLGLVEEADIERLIAEHADKGMEMINKFLEEMKDVE